MLESSRDMLIPRYSRCRDIVGSEYINLISCLQGRRRRYGRTTFLAENGFGRTTIFDYSVENVSSFLKCDGPI